MVPLNELVCEQSNGTDIVSLTGLFGSQKNTLVASPLDQLSTKVRTLMLLKLSGITYIHKFTDNVSADICIYSNARDVNVN